MSQSLDLKLDDLAQRSDQFEAGMQARFKLPLAALDPIYTDGSHISVWEPDAHHWEQVVTHLQLLGYLPDAGEPNREDIDAALGNWEREFRLGKKRGQFSLTLSGERTRSVPWAELRFRYLKAMATFEGEVLLKTLPLAGAVSIGSRIANMRLKVFGLSRAVSGRSTVVDDLFGADSPFGESSLKSARIGVSVFFGSSDAASPLELLNLLGHAPAATDLFLSRRGAARYLFKGEDRGETVSLARFRVNRAPPEWVGRWEKVTSGWELRDAGRMSIQRMPSLNSRGPSADRQMFSEVLVENAQLPLNLVALELLQLRLWMFGYYEGEVDGHWGPFTEKALDLFVADHGKAFRALDTIVRSGWKGWRVVNLYRIFAYMVDYLDVPSEHLSVGAMEEVSEAAADSLDGEDWNRVEGNYLALQESESSREFSGGVLRNRSSNKRRKRYFGWRRVFAAIGSFFRRVGQSVVEAGRKLAKALKQGMRFAFGVFGYLWGKVRIAVRVARLALRRLSYWFFGKPFGSRDGKHWVLTRWSLDYDTVQYVSRECAEELLGLHAERLDWMARSLAFMSEFALLVLSVLKKAAIGAWLWVGYTLFRSVRSLLKNPDYRGLFSERIFV